MTQLERLFKKVPNDSIKYLKMEETQDRLEKIITDYRNKYPNETLLISFFTSKKSLETHIVKFVMGKPLIKNILDIFYKKSFIQLDKFKTGKEDIYNCSQGIIKLIIGSKEQLLFYIL